MQPPLFSGVLVMPKYENPAKKKVNFLQDSLCYWYRLFSASHGKTAESRMDSRQNHKNDSKDDHWCTKSVRACTTQTDSVRFMPRL